MVARIEIGKYHFKQQGIPNHKKNDVADGENVRFIPKGKLLLKCKGKAQYYARSKGVIQVTMNVGDEDSGFFYKLVDGEKEKTNPEIGGEKLH